MNTLELEIARMRKGKTRLDMASAIGKSLNAYAKKETGKTPFSDEEKLALAAELDLTMEQFSDIFLTTNYQNGNQRVRVAASEILLRTKECRNE